MNFVALNILMMSLLLLFTVMLSLNNAGCAVKG